MWAMPVPRAEIIGRRFGMLVVLGDALDRRMASVRCDCGTEKTVARSNLLGGGITSCGCRNRAASAARCRSRVVQRSGHRYGRLVAIKYLGNRYWMCACDCGQNTRVQGSNLTRGCTLSCGCYSAENTSRRSRTHGHARPGAPSLTYRSWRAMHTRCTHPHTRGYKNYGGRGIRVCKRWSGRGGFERFLADMGERPAGTTLERNDTNGNYEPGNCRWATSQEQSNNRRLTVRLSVGGRTMPVVEWAAETGLSAATIHNRLHRGWTAEQAVSLAARPHGSEVTEAAKRLGLSRYSIYDRLRKGWSREEALTTPRQH